MRKIVTTNNQIEFQEIDNNGILLNSVGLQLGEVYFIVKNGRVSFYLNDSEKPFDSFVWSIDIPFYLDDVLIETPNDASAKLGAIMNDSFQEQLDALQEELATEEGRAQAAEEALDGKIDDEIARAVSAETHLQGEITEMSGTVATFDNRITNVENGLSALTETVNDEITRSTAKDAEHDAQISGLTTSLQNEVTRATSAETVLHNEILAERDRALVAESGLTNALNAEVSRSTAKDASQDALISGLSTSLQNEINRAQGAENSLRSDLNAEISARTNADAAQLQRITALEVGKADANSVYTKQESDAKYTTKDYISGLTNNFFDDAKYEDSGTTKVINFYHGNTVKATINATDFIKDGMVDNVEIVNNNLVITFNTDSGKEPIPIPLTDIFDPSIYYTKSETSGATQIANALAAKANKATTLAGYGITNAYTKSETSGATQIANALGAKQDVLTEGRAIDITNNVISLDLPISAGTVTGSIIENSNSNKASGIESHAEGRGTTASGDYSHTEGAGTTASSQSSHAEGQDTTASGASSHAEGQYATASGNQSHAEGYNTVAIGNYGSHAEGQGTTASGDSSHAEGDSTKASGNYSHAEGNQTTANGVDSHAEGTLTIASGDSSHAEGDSTKASGNYSHAEGYATSATSTNSHSEGGDSLASGTYSHAEGRDTIASGDFASHAEGRSTIASGATSHAEGGRTIAYGKYSHVEGSDTIANNNYEHASGIYNVSNKVNTTFGDSGNTLFSVGNGTISERHNAFEIRQNGDIYITSGNTTIKLQDNLGSEGGTFDPTQYYTTAQTYSKTEVNAAVSGKADSSTVSSLNNVVTAHTASTSIHVTSSEKQLWNNKSDFSGSYNDLTNKLSAGTNITIVDNVISAQGGGVNVVQTTGTSTTDVMSQDAVTTQLNNKANKSAAVGGYRFGSSSDVNYLKYRNVSNDDIGSDIYYPKINGKGILTNNSTFAKNNYNFQLVETSAITTSVTSASTDSQIPSAKAVYDAIQEGGGSSYSAGSGITISNNVISAKIWSGTLAQYNALSTKDADTIYLIYNS